MKKESICDKRIDNALERLRGIATKQAISYKMKDGPVPPAAFLICLGSMYQKLTFQWLRQPADALDSKVNSWCKSTLMCSSVLCSGHCAQAPWAQQIISLNSSRAEKCADLNMYKAQKHFIISYHQKFQAMASSLRAFFKTSRGGMIMIRSGQ